MTQAKPLGRDAILATLPRLKTSDLKAIRAACSALLGEAATPHAANGQNAPSGPLGWLYDGLLSVTGLHISYEQFSKTLAGKQFKRFGPDLVAFAEDGFAEQMSKKVSGMAITRLLLDLIMADLRQRGMPVTLGTITAHMAQTRFIFEAAFPGYLEAGLTPLITARMKRQ